MKIKEIGGVTAEQNRILLECVSPEGGSETLEMSMEAASQCLHILFDHARLSGQHSYRMLLKSAGGQIQDGYPVLSLLPHSSIPLNFLINRDNIPILINILSDLYQASGSPTEEH